MLVEEFELFCSCPPQHHSYVQFTKLLAKCYVGKLVMESSVKKRKQAMSTPPLLTVPGKRTQGRLSLPSLQPPTLNFPKSLNPVSETIVKTEDEDSGVEIPVDTGSIHLRQAGTPDTPDSMLSEEGTSAVQLYRTNISESLYNTGVHTYDANGMCVCVIETTSHGKCV